MATCCKINNIFLIFAVLDVRCKPVAFNELFYIAVLFTFIQVSKIIRCNTETLVLSKAYYTIGHEVTTQKLYSHCSRFISKRGDIFEQIIFPKFINFYSETLSVSIFSYFS